MRVVLALLLAPMLVACAEPNKPVQPRSSSSSFVVTASVDDDEDPWSFEAIEERYNVVLPVNPTQADALQPRTSERGETLLRKFKSGVAQHPEWWVEYAGTHSAGEEGPPYHPNMGLSEAEYEEMGRLLDKVELTTVGTVQLTFLNRGDGRISIDSPELPNLLRDLVLDLQHNYVETPFGRLTERDDVDNRDPNAPTGSWSGPGWKMEQPATSDLPATIVRFALGRRDQDQKGVLYYRYMRLVPGQQPERMTLFLVYDDPGINEDA